MQRFKLAKGLMLLELLICLALTALLIGLGAVSWAKLQERQQATVVLSQLLQSLQFAKQVAMAKHEQVSICPAENDKACGDNWSNGWLIFIDPENHGQPETENQILSHQAAFHGKLQLRFSGWLSHRYVRFEMDGTPHSYHGTFFMNDQPIVVINAVGRIREVGE